MIIRDAHQLAAYQEAAKISTEILNQLRQSVKLGVTPLEVDALADELCAKAGVTPNFKGVGPKHNQYQYATCISVNDTVVHGIPDDRPFQDGDLVKVDFGLEYQGLNTDHCFTVGVGEVSARDLELMRVAKKSVQQAAKKAIAGNRVGDLGYTMQTGAEAAGFSVVREFVGHGIGHTLHDDPQIPAYGKPQRGELLREGMVICVESQVIGHRNPGVGIDDDGWTVKSLTGAKSAMFEYMVVVGKDKALFLTETLDWPLLAE